MNPLRERIREEREIFRMIGPRAFRKKRVLLKKDLRSVRVVIRRSMPLRPNPKWYDTSRIPSCGNIFADLGFPAAEAEKMLADLETEVEGSASK